MKKKILITGGTGLIGSAVTNQLALNGNEVTIFSRDPHIDKLKFPAAIKFVQWNYIDFNGWKTALEEKDIIIHLSGANLDAKRWSNKYKKLIYDSRILSTRNLVNAVRECQTKPELFITASAVGIYSDRGEEFLTEDSHPGNDFLSRVCNDWEYEATKVEEFGVRRVSLRCGIILSNKGGALKRFLIPFKLFAGGPLGNGKQWFPWIHIDDLVNIFIHMIDNKTICGSVNCASPGIVRMKEFTKILGKIIKRPSIFRIPKFILRIVVGELADAITASQHVLPQKLEHSDFNFRFTDLDSALRDLLKMPNQ